MAGDNERWRQVLHEYIVYGLLFKSVMADLPTMERIPFKLNYSCILGKLSLWAEKQHLHFGKQLIKAGCQVLNSKTRDDCYYVQTKVNGYVHEHFYNSEYLRAECEVRLRQMIEQQWFSKLSPYNCVKTDSL